VVDLFVSGHGIWTVLENVAIAPVLAVISFVCSVGNIPLAAALWAHGVAFGGVISFIFADLVTLPCCSSTDVSTARGPRFDSSASFGS